MDILNEGFYKYDIKVYKYNKYSLYDKKNYFNSIKLFINNNLITQIINPKIYDFYNNYNQKINLSSYGLNLYNFCLQFNKKNPNGSVNLNELKLKILFNLKKKLKTTDLFFQNYHNILKDYIGTNSQIFFLTLNYNFLVKRENILKLQFQ